MKKIPIIAALSALLLVAVILTPLLGATWPMSSRPTGDPSQCYVQKEDGEFEPCKKEIGIEFPWPSPDAVQGSDRHYQEPSQTDQIAFTDGVTEIINPNYKPLTYHKTTKIIDDTYLGKDVNQWQNSGDLELESFHSQYGGEFYSNLGTLLIKNEMQYQMNSLGIVNAEDDFEVTGGWALASLSPHLGFSTIIYATDGHYYWLQGGTNSNRVSYYKTTQLQYPDETKYPKIDSIASKGLPRVSVTEDDNDLIVSPNYVVLAEPGEAEFFNHATEELTVHLYQEGIPYDILSELSTRSNSGMTIPFGSPGVYSFNAKVPKNTDGKQYVLNTSGAIVVLSEDMGDLPMPVKMEISTMLLTASELPIVSTNRDDGDNVLYIGLDPTIDAFLPESRQYYLDAAQSLIPFDIRIALDYSGTHKFVQSINQHLLESIIISQKSSVFHEGFDSISGFLSVSKSYGLLTHCTNFCLSL